MVYNRVGVVDLTPFAKLEVKGPDACDFMDRICANAVPKVNDSMYVILTDVECDSYLFKWWCMNVVTLTIFFS